MTSVRAEPATLDREDGANSHCNQSAPHATTGVHRAARSRTTTDPHRATTGPHHALVYDAFGTCPANRDTAPESL